MSDPVTHAEIEDVLSSIRRLVSEDSSSEDAAPQPAARLVLTPALRVQEGGRKPAPEPAAPAASSETAAASGAPEPVLNGVAGRITADDAALKDAVPEHAAPEETPGDEPEDAGGLDRATLAADLAEELAAEPALAFRHRSGGAAGTPAARTGADPETGADRQADAAAQPGPAAAEPDAAAGQDAQVAADDGAPWVRPGATLFAAAAGAAGQGEAAADGAADPSGSAAGRAASVVRKIAEMEAARSQDRTAPAAQPHWEPDSKTEAPFASAGPDVIEWRDEPLRQPSAAPGRKAPQEPELPEDLTTETARELRRPDAEAAGPGAGRIEALARSSAAEAAMEALEDGLGGAGEAYLDEDSLRDLVSSIVREELQGALGERITRNVRKLVRREIQRALAAQDLL